MQGINDERHAAVEKDLCATYVLPQVELARSGDQGRDRRARRR